ncbi:hypothetical protein [Ornithinimicrobium murale]|uniref:hypothetical protein n=1 Tax=Ornithinimicrobium murale TaxID=1050153 RepID=UPI0013B436A4|nr:hypothetical protein [Ornithinimicrobium murale]
MAPADEVLGTLCNLRQSHVELLSSRILVDGQIDVQMLRLAALSLSDDLGVWEGIAWQYADLEDELDAARSVYGHWEYAIGLTDVDDVDAAVEQIEEAELVIDTLPGDEVVEVGC